MDQEDKKSVLTEKNRFYAQVLINLDFLKKLVAAEEMPVPLNYHQSLEIIVAIEKVEKLVEASRQQVRNELNPKKEP